MFIYYKSTGIHEYEKIVHIHHILMLYHIHLRNKTGEYDKAFKYDINLFNFLKKPL